jgi:hypothetical protein
VSCLASVLGLLCVACCAWRVVLKGVWCLLRGADPVTWTPLQLRARRKTPCSPQLKHCSPTAFALKADEFGRGGSKQPPIQASKKTVAYTGVGDKLNCMLCIFCVFVLNTSTVYFQFLIFVYRTWPC